jgi:hypothetical protein
LKRTDSTSSISKIEVLRKTNAWLTGDIEDSSSITRNSADSKTLIINFIPIALSTNSIDWVVSSNAAALTIGEDFIHSTSDYTESSLVSISWRAATGLGFGIIGSVSRAWTANTFNTVEIFSTIASLGHSVVDFTSLTSNSADFKGSIEIGSVSAFLACTTNKEESLLTNALLVNEEHVRSTRAGGNWKRLGWNWSSSSRDAISIIKNISLNTFAWFRWCAVNSVGLAASTDSVDVKETSLTNALKSVEIKNFVGSAFGSADGELSVIIVRGSAVGANSFD